MEPLVKSSLPPNARLELEKPGSKAFKQLGKTQIEFEIDKYLERDPSLLVSGAPGPEQEKVNQLAYYILEVADLDVYGEPEVLSDAGISGTELEYEGFASTKSLIGTVPEETDELLVATQDYTVPRFAAEINSTGYFRAPENGFFVHFEDFPEPGVKAFPSGVVTSEFWRGVSNMVEEYGFPEAVSRAGAKASSRIGRPDLEPLEEFDLEHRIDDTNSYDALVLGAPVVESVEELEYRMASEQLKYAAGQQLKDGAKLIYGKVTGSEPDF